MLIYAKWVIFVLVRFRKQPCDKIIIKIARSNLVCIRYLNFLNTRYMTNSTLVSPVKMEYGWNFSISGLKMMMKSGLGKIFLKFLHALTMLFLLLNLYFWSKFSNKNDMVSAWRNFKNIFPRPLFIIIFRPEMLKFHHIPVWPGTPELNLSYTMC